jgi:hypothetical protein
MHVDIYFVVTALEKQQRESDRCDTFSQRL